MRDEQQQQQQHEQVQVTQSDQPQNKWGDPISIERQEELLGMLMAWEAPDADHSELKGPFDNGTDKEGVALTGADVYWLTPRGGPKTASPPNPPPGGAYLFAAPPGQAPLRG